MANVPTTKIASSDANAWATIASGPDVVIDTLNYASTSGSSGSISVRVVQGGSNAMLLAPVLVPASGSGQVRIGTIALETGHTLQVRSTSPFDWVASGEEPE